MVIETCRLIVSWPRVSNHQQYDHAITAHHVTDRQTDRRTDGWIELAQHRMRQAYSMTKTLHRYENVYTK